MRFIAKRDTQKYFMFAALQSNVGRDLLTSHGLLADELKTIVLIEQGKVFTQSEAILKISQHLHRAWPLLAALRVIPRPLRDGCYRFIATHRYRWFGQKTTCEFPPENLKARFL